MLKKAENYGKFIEFLTYVCVCEIFFVILREIRADTGDKASALQAEGLRKNFEKNRIYEDNIDCRGEAQFHEDSADN